MDTDDLLCLRDVIAAGSLTAVARKRGVAVSTIARRLDAIEATLKLTLVDRGRSGAQATEHGRRIIALATPLLDEADRLARAAESLRHDRRREIVVTATEAVISDVLAPAIPQLAPEIRLDLRAEAAVVSLAGREADIAIRMSQPQGASLIAKKLKPLRLGLYCSPAYLAGRAADRLVLTEERLLVYDESYGRLPELGWLGPRLLGAVACRTNSTRALLNMAVAGVGIAILPAIFAVPSGLCEVSAGITLAPRTPWIVIRADLRREPDMRKVQAWISQAFASAARRGDAPWRGGATKRGGFRASQPSA